MRYLKIGLAIIVFLMLIWVAWGSFGVKSEGWRIGKFYKLSRKGIAFKTWEGELLLADVAMKTTDAVWHFSVNSNETKVLEQLNGISQKNTEVKLYYREKIWTFPWQGETDYFVYKVEFLK